MSTHELHKQIGQLEGMLQKEKEEFEVANVTLIPPKRTEIQSDHDVYDDKT